MDSTYKYNNKMTQKQFSGISVEYKLILSGGIYGLGVTSLVTVDSNASRWKVERPRVITLHLESQYFYEQFWLSSKC